MGEKMPKRWKKVKLGEVAEIKMGQSPKSEFYNTEGKGLPFLQGNRTFGYRYPKIDIYCSNPIKIADKGDILFSVRAPVGDINIANQTICIGRGLAALKSKNDENLFLYYLLHYTKKEILNSEGGTVFGSISKRDLESLEVLIPEDLNEQKAIAGVLSSFDDKIDLLHRQNKTLEEMAQTLFRKWFIEDAKEDWEEKPLGELVTIKRGSSPRPIQNYLSNNGLKWLKISDITNLNSPFIFDIKEHIKEEGLNKTVLLKSDSLILSNSATPGIPKILQMNSCIHDGWLYFPKSYFSNEFLYLLFLYIRPQLLMQGNGSIFTNLKTSILKEFVITVPDKNSLANFQIQVNPIFKKLLNNSKQIRTLERLRDTLLPKLMSGKIRMKYEG
ncbi:restriction endonuclease subunit S [Nitrosophilus labii]|uniref:restriction endonuclease subunit S n=1 Tax=Nitrosophilus labii TaxID=2706014 RepID=UPI001656EB0B|nr:restriction endonuclease subunit S [Nitrosophilus labii]